MNFTEDWFSHNIPNFETCMSAIPDKRLFLEIGAFEGRSTCWLLENGLNDKGSIVCIDPFSGSVEHGSIDFKAVEARFWSNTNLAKKSSGQTVSLMRTTSYKALAEMIGFKNVPDKLVLTDQYGFIQTDKPKYPFIIIEEKI